MYRYRFVLTSTLQSFARQLVVPQGDEKVLEHSVYTLGNACAAHLVRRTKQWEGPSSYGVAYGTVLDAKRPREGMWKYVDDDAGAQRKSRRRKKPMNAKRARQRGRSKLPRVARVPLVRPPIFPGMSDEALRQLIHTRLDVRERELIEERRLAGKTVLGMSR